MSCVNRIESQVYKYLSGGQYNGCVQDAETKDGSKDERDWKVAPEPLVENKQGACLNYITRRRGEATTYRHLEALGCQQPLLAKTKLLYGSLRNNKAIT